MKNPILGVGLSEEEVNKRYRWSEFGEDQMKESWSLFANPNHKLFQVDALAWEPDISTLAE